MLPKRVLFLLLLTPFFSLYAFTVTSDTVIYIDEEDPVKINAAQELTNYLKPVTGFYLPYTAKSPAKGSKSKIIIAKRDSRLLQKHDLSFSLNRLKKDGFILYAASDTLYIIASNDRALLYGVYHFLERYVGYRFLDPDYTYTPPPHKITLSDKLDIEEPAFAYREIFISESDDWKYAAQNRLNGRLGHRTDEAYQDPNFGRGINIFNIFTPYALVPQKRYHCNGQLPYSDKKVQQIAAKAVAQKLEDLSVKAEDYLYIQHEDRNSFCDRDGKTPQEATAAFLRYGIAIEKEINKKAPRRNFLLEAYQWTRQVPPHFIKLPDHTAVMFSTIEANFANALHEGENRKILDDLKQWKNDTDNVIVWHYATNFSGYFQPHPDLFALSEDIQTFARLPHVKGVFLQGAYETTHSEFAALRIWLFAKLLWNPSADAKALIGEFCRYYYGDAASYVVRYIEQLHKIARSEKQKLFVKTAPNAAYLHEKHLDTLEAILDEAIHKVAEDSPFHEHLLQIYASLDYVRLLNSTDKTKRAKSKKRFLAFLHEHPEIEHYAEGTDIDSLKAIVAMERKRPRLPKEAKGLEPGTEWLDFQEYTLRLCCAEIVQDPDASDQIAAVMRGEQNAWGFQLDVNTNLPKGTWEIYARVKITLPQQHTLLDKGKVALFFGIHPTLIKGAYFVAQFTPNTYKTIKIGTIDTRKTHADYIWISPPENDTVKKLYVDRIFAIKKD